MIGGPVTITYGTLCLLVAVCMIFWCGHIALGGALYAHCTCTLYMGYHFLALHMYNVHVK